MYITGLHPSFREWAPKTLSGEGLQSVFCYVNEITLGKHLECALSPGEATRRWEGWNFQSLIPKLCRGEWGWCLRSNDNGHWFNQCLYNEGSKKPQRTGLKGRPYWNTRRCGESRVPAKGMEDSFSLPIACIGISSMGYTWLTLIYNEQIVLKKKKRERDWPKCKKKKKRKKRKKSKEWDACKWLWKISNISLGMHSTHVHSGACAQERSIKILIY